MILSGRLEKRYVVSKEWILRTDGVGKGEEVDVYCVEGRLGKVFVSIDQD
jgi:hypothetical protein